jgi:UDP-glucose 4-epimerase
VVGALVATANADSAVGGTIDVGSGVLTSVRGVVAVVAIACLIQSSAAPQFGALPDRSNERVRAADVERASSLLGWAPSMSLEQGLKATVDWYATRAEVP